MTHIEVCLMALALAMDCFAVSIASGIIFKRVIWKPMLTMAFLFGFFQALNPFLGWWGTDQFRSIIESVDHWLAFAILGFLPEPQRSLRKLRTLLQLHLQALSLC